MDVGLRIVGMPIFISNFKHNLCINYMGAIMFDKRIMISVIFIVGFLAISAVSADDNITSAFDDYNARIIAKDVSREYDPVEANTVLFRIVDMDGKAVDDAKPTATYDNKKVDVIYDYEHYFSSKHGTYYIDRVPELGNHKVKITLDSPNYSAKPVLINVKITKMPTKLALKKYVTTNKEYAVMKATVKDRFGDIVDEGKVIFKVNGKSYSAKVKDGVAVKKIKLSKAKTYNYKATFSAKNYVTKTASSKLYIKKAKKYYTLKIRNPKIKKTFKVKLPYKQYVKILNAKNKNKFAYASVDTGIKRPPEWGGGHYCVGLSTKDVYFTYYDYDLADYVFLRASSYLCIKKVNLYTANF